MFKTPERKKQSTTQQVHANILEKETVKSCTEIGGLVAFTTYAESKLTVQHLFHVMWHREKPPWIFCVSPLRQGEIFKPRCGKVRSLQRRSKARMLHLAWIYLDSQVNYYTFSSLIPIAYIFPLFKPEESSHWSQIWILIKKEIAMQVDCCVLQVICLNYVAYVWIITPYHSVCSL